MATKTGTNNSETITGTSTADTLLGLGGNDTLIGGGGADVLNGGDGFDFASYVNSTIGITVNLATPSQNTGEAIGDSYISVEGLRGSKFNDKLFGDGGNNLLQGGLGADVLNGGAGSDTADYNNAATAIKVNLATPSQNTGEAAGDTYVSIENIRGGKFNDTLIGDANTNTLRGGLGADVLNGAGGFDFASYSSSTAGIKANLTTPSQNTGEAAGDTYISIEGLRGSDFNDTLIGDANGNFLQGGLGADALNGGAGLDYADYNNATVGVKVNLAAPAQNTGEAAGDTFVSIENIRGSAFNDTLIGDANSNTLRGGLGADVLNGGAGFDFASYANATAGIKANLAAPSQNTGEAAGDSYTSIEALRGGDFNDTLVGDANLNFLNGGAGADVLNGGAGSDYADYINATAAVKVNLAAPAQNTGEAAGDTFTSIENIRGSAFNDTLIGDAHDNSLRGGLGADVLNGGAGFDFASYANATAGLKVNLATPSQNTGEAAGDTYISIEELRGSDFNDILVGDAGNNLLQGGLGADVLNGGSAGLDYADYFNSAVGLKVNLTTPSQNTGEAVGDTYTNIYGIRGSAFNDTLIGNASNNSLRGGAGADVLNGGGGSDFASYSNSAVGLKVNLATPSQNTGEAVGDTYISIENLRGSDFNDTLIGNSGNNYLQGGLGADVLDGSGGNDTADYFTATAAVRVNLATPSQNTGEATGDTFPGIENIRGGSFADILIGNNGANTLNGADGKDTLTGAAGNDVFLFNSALNATTNVDRITDFTHGADKIDLENAIFTVLTTPGTLAAAAFFTGAAAHDADDRIIYNASTGALIYDSNGNAAGGATQFATLAVHLTLNNTDFVVV